MDLHPSHSPPRDSPFTRDAPTPGPQVASPNIVSNTVSFTLRYLANIELPQLTTVLEDGMVVWLPKATLSRTPSCVLDSQCDGRGVTEAPVAGTCVDNHCVCPSPYAGPFCDRTLECGWYEDTSGWQESTLCALDASRGSEQYHACVCNLTGSFDVLVVETAHVPLEPAKLIGISPIDLSQALTLIGLGA